MASQILHNKQLIQTSIFLAPATAIFIAGYGYSAGHAVSHLSDVRPQQSTGVFSKIFHGGSGVVVPLGLLSSTLSTYLAYLTPSPLQRNIYIFSAASCFSAIPFTRLVMWTGIQRLIEISESKQLQDKTEQNLEYRQLMKSWVGQNGVRVVLFGSAGLAALWGAVIGWVV